MCSCSQSTRCLLTFNSNTKLWVPTCAMVDDFLPSASNLSQQRDDPFLALEPRQSMYLRRSAVVDLLQLIIETPLRIFLLQYREMGKLPGCQSRSTDTTCMSNVPRGFNQG